jgi:histidine triad (HIT) family protein
MMKDDCIFCQIIRGEQTANFLYKDKSVVVFNDIHPHAPVHVLIVPTQHIRSINEITEKESGIVSNLILKGQEMAEMMGIAETGYKLLFNVERGGGQVIFHLHLHLLGGWK